MKKLASPRAAQFLLGVLSVTECLAAVHLNIFLCLKSGLPNRPDFYNPSAFPGLQKHPERGEKVGRRGWCSLLERSAEYFWQAGKVPAKVGVGWRNALCCSRNWEQFELSSSGFPPLCLTSPCVAWRIQCYCGFFVQQRCSFYQEVVFVLLACLCVP